MTKFHFTQQLGIKDCGPACLKMVAAWHGQHFALDFLRNRSHITKMGVSMLGITEAAESIGMRTMGVKLNFENLKRAIESGPVIVHWTQNHFIVVYEIQDSIFGNYIRVADPAVGLLKITKKQFYEGWVGYAEDDEEEDEKELYKQPGLALLLEPTPSFYEPNIEGKEKKADFSVMWLYAAKYRRFFIQLLFGMALGSSIMLAGPFLTQALVDKGIGGKNIHFVYLILMAQFMLFIGGTLVDIIRSRILLHIGSRINISMVSDFFMKMLNLPISFFETHITGDLMQRIENHKRVESLLTTSSLNTVFSTLNLIVLSIILINYHAGVFAIFMAGSVLGLIWTILFLKKRRTLDFEYFDIYSKQNNKIIEILDGIEDIKVSNSTKQKRWEWEDTQAKLYSINLKSLSISQVSQIGGDFISQLTGLAISLLTAKAVIDGNITIGGMFAINMITGQLQSPINQLYGFINTVQRAKIGLERIQDVTREKDEEQSDAVRDILPSQPIKIESLSFTYGSKKLEPVLKKISCVIPEAKVTAIVGASGSGKTTLMKILLRFYEPDSGDIFLGGQHFKNLLHSKWRDNCGVVMQEGTIFSGSIAYNIALGREIDWEKVNEAAKIANIDTFITSLPLGYLTEIGAEGSNISVGQKQRLLLARAIYKNPQYLFLDEATSSLDATNEKIIIENLAKYFKGKTVVIIAHRLSTVTHADQIIVLNKGVISESGTHQELINTKGEYYQLVKNQLELGN